jgi:hypothetical protein
LLLLSLKVATVVLVAVTMGLAVAHALEFPGKLPLDQQMYLAVQTIYYPGFTIGGISEPVAIVALLILLLSTPRKGTGFWWTLSCLLAVIAMQVNLLARNAADQSILAEKTSVSAPLEQDSSRLTERSKRLLQNSIARTGGACEIDGNIPMWCERSSPGWR